MTFPVPLDLDWSVLASTAVVFATAAFTLLFGLFQRDGRATAGLALLGLATAAMFELNVLQTNRLGQSAGSAFGLQWWADGPAVTLHFAILIGTALAVLVSWDYLARADLDRSEYYPLLLLSAGGAMVLTSAGDLVVLLLGLEIMSLPVYVLSAWRRGAHASEEAGMKYFLLGAFGSAFLIYGIALTYGAGGAFRFDALAAAFTADGFASAPLALVGGLLVLGGLGFKAALAPFHQWAPDAYYGAPTPVTGFMSVVVKTAAFAALLRVVATVYPAVQPQLHLALAVLVALTLIIGNFAALVQSSVKRMLAYSAVAHAGYLGLGVLAVDAGGIDAVAWYLLAYTLMTGGAFAVLTLVADADDRGDEIERFAGLGRRRPYLALAMTLFLLSLAGLPPLAGFAGKVLVFGAALEAGWTSLAVLAIVTSVVAVAYYFRVVAAMWFRDRTSGPVEARSAATSWAVGVAAAVTLLLGLFPGGPYGLIEGGGRLLLAGF